MSISYTWQDALNFLESYARNIPMSKVDTKTCDAVSSEMWTEFPWNEACQTIPPQLLEDGVQDYDSPPTFYKLVALQIIQTLPNITTFDPLLIVNMSLPEMSVAQNPGFIRSAAYQSGEGLIRLSFPTTVNVNEAFELHGTYQMQHTRVIDLNQPCWFTDQLWHVAQEGLLYWAYKLANNWKASADQYKVFKGKLQTAWMKEKQGGADVLEPEVNFGQVRNWG